MPTQPPRANQAPFRFRIDRLRTPLGELSIVCSERGLCALDFDDFQARMHALFARRYGAYELVAASDPLGVTSRVASYFQGDLGSLDAIEVDPAGTPYQHRVWQQLRKIPAGQTCSYGQLAAQVGGTHARAIGGANAVNPVAIVIPCHRVIGADTTLTGYAGGMARKRWLLDHEDAGGARVLPF